MSSKAKEFSMSRNSSYLYRSWHFPSWCPWFSHWGKNVL